MQGTNFSYTHEYAYFVIPSGKKTIGNRKISEQDIGWSKLRNWGGESKREDAKNCFYPIIINPHTAEIIRFDEVCGENFHPDSANIYFKDEIQVYPIDNEGVERKWRYARQSVESIKHLLRAKKVKNIWNIEIGKDFGSYKTVWIDSRYDANEYGTKLIAKMVPNCDFNFPKSLYNVYDCTYAVIGRRKNAIVLDYFAGSGTTGHAVLQLNSEDGGNRQFILCTNNENKIAEQITYPRIRSAINGYKIENEELIKGLGSNLKYYKTDFVGSEPTHRNKKLLTDKSIEMLCIKENTFDEVMNKKDIFIFKNKEKFTAILFDEMKMEEFKNEVKKLKMPVSVYVFSLEGDDFKEEFENLKNDITLCSIPEAILKVYRRIYGAGQMKLKNKK
ncbi:MAG: DNA methyltransferase [Candidatus Brocadiaceae bacterium]|nr:DNA methyltransferase [Candidatus Brocadiaceae bacterium]